MKAFFLFLSTSPTARKLLSGPRLCSGLIQRFIAGNPDGLSTSVDVEYQCGVIEASAAANPDASGDFQVAISIPSGCPAPSTNSIVSTIRAAGQSTGVVEVITHDLVEAICVIPPSGDWTVSQNCTLLGSAIAQGNVIVEENIALTIAQKVALDIDFSNFHLLIKSGAKVVIKTGGKIF